MSTFAYFFWTAVVIGIFLALLLFGQSSITKGFALAGNAPLIAALSILILGSIFLLKLITKK